MTDDQVAIATAEDEVLIREYEISEIDYRIHLFKQVKTPTKKRGKYNTTGTMYVTNRRLIYNVDNRSLPTFGLRCKDLCSQQIRIDDILGIDFMTSKMKGSLILPILFVLFSLFLTMLIFPIGIILLIIGIVWLFIRYRNVEEHMMIGIRSAASDYSLYVSEMSRGYGGNVSYWCAPTKEFEIMAKELGAIILDLQKYGDDAISKWTDSE